MRFKFLMSFLLGLVVSLSANGISSGGNTMDKIVKLPKPIINKHFSLDQAIEKRRSVRSFKKQTLADAELANLLWAAQGITDKIRGLRAAPSAGALYPLQLYVVNNSGFFKYSPQEHFLEMQINKDLRAQLSDCCLRQVAVKNAPVSVVIAADTNVTAKKYGERAVRYVYIEAGHAAQNILLESVSLGLSAVPIGGFDDGAIKKLLALPEVLTILYVIPVG